MKKTIILGLVLLMSYSLFSQSSGSVSHDKWAKMLNQYVTENGNVNYDGFKESESQLDQYLNHLKSNAPKDNWSKEHSMAYWINAYNAFTIKLILKNYPLKSIMEVNSGKAWDLQFIEIGGKKLSLNDIEHNILRKRYKDPRIHFAVNCASVSCPKLVNRPFLATTLQVQLENAAKQFVNNAKKNSISADKIQISKLFEWYSGDFTDGQSLIAYLNKYSKIKINPKAKISYMAYDWNLNSK